MRISVVLPSSFVPSLSFSRPIPADGEPSVELYNDELSQLAEKKLDTWFSAPWLYAEYVQTHHSGDDSDINHFLRGYLSVMTRLLNNAKLMKLDIVFCVPTSYKLNIGVLETHFTHRK